MNILQTTLQKAVCPEWSWDGLGNFSIYKLNPDFMTEEQFRNDFDATIVSDSRFFRVVTAPIAFYGNTRTPFTLFQMSELDDIIEDLKNTPPNEKKLDTK